MNSLAHDAGGSTRDEAADDVSDRRLPTGQPSAVASWGWILAVIWLVFLIFPVMAIWADDLATSIKAVATGSIVVFAAVFTHGFRTEHRQALRQLEFGGGDDQEDHQIYDGRLHFLVLVAIQLLVFALVGLGSLGIVSFVVSFAVFHFRWRVALSVFAVSTLATIALPIALGRFEDVWFLAVIVISVGTLTILIRVLDTQQADFANLRTTMAVTDERSRVARDVHDVLGHSLTVVILKAELCQRLLATAEPTDAATRATVDTCRQQLAELRSVSRDALAEIRSTVGGLRATNLGDEITAARTVLGDAGVKLLVTGDPSGVGELHRPMLAWVVREGVTNIVRHADASTCHLAIGPAPGDDVDPTSTVLLRLTDDGVGITSGHERAEGNGLRGLRERVEAAGARLTVGPATAEGSDRSGTAIEVVV